MEADEKKKAELAERARTEMQKAAIQLLIDKEARGVFFSHLALRMKCEPKFGVGTACTDGEMILYEPEFILGLGTKKTTGLLVHEIMHCVMLHHIRGRGRDKQLANIAMDLAINDIILEAGYELPCSDIVVGYGPFKDYPKGLSFEEYYDMLQKDSDKMKKKYGQNQDPGGCGGTQAPEGEAKESEQEGEWQCAVAAATAAAKQRGDVPASIQRIIGACEDSKVDWRAELREFLNRPHPERNDWCRPNRRYLNHGLYLPTLNGERLGHIACAIDTSGSIGEADIAEFGAEIMGIIGARPTKLSVVWCDCQINRVDTYEDITREDLNLKGCGGGGTSHVPVFKWLSEQTEDMPECIVCLTDLATEFPDRHPDVPVLWVTNQRGGNAPFGKVIQLR